MADEQWHEIIDRLAMGERLIATTAAGVTWGGGYKAEDLPNREALHRCLAEGLVRAVDVATAYGAYTIPAREIVLTVRSIDEATNG